MDMDTHTHSQDDGAWPRIPMMPITHGPWHGVMDSKVRRALPDGTIPRSSKSSRWVCTLPPGQVLGRYLPHYYSPRQVLSSHPKCLVFIAPVPSPSFPRAVFHLLQDIDVSLLFSQPESSNTETLAVSAALLDARLQHSYCLSFALNPTLFIPGANILHIYSCHSHLPKSHQPRLGASLPTSPWQLYNTLLDTKTFAFLEATHQPALIFNMASPISGVVGSEAWHMSLAARATGPNQDASSQAGIGIVSFLTAIGVSIAIFAAQFTLFSLLRNKLARILYVPPKKHAIIFLPLLPSQSRPLVIE